MIHYIQVIGEATTKISEETRLKNPSIPWKQIIAMRNILVNAYFSVDIEEIWNVIERDIPTLEK